MSELYISKDKKTRIISQFDDVNGKRRYSLQHLSEPWRFLFWTIPATWRTSGQCLKAGIPGAVTYDPHIRNGWIKEYDMVEA